MKKQHTSRSYFNLLSCLSQLKNLGVLNHHLTTYYLSITYIAYNQYQQLSFMSSVPFFDSNTGNFVELNGIDEYQNSSSSQQDYTVPSFWNKAFPHFQFKKMLAQTESSLIWEGVQRNTQQIIALKINEIFEGCNSQQMHQQKETVFVNQYHLSHMAQIKKVQFGKGYRLMAMTCYPWNLVDILNKFTGNAIGRYSEIHQNFVIYAFKSMIAAVQQLHAQGYVHRDLKPDNFLINEKLQIFISDFGLITKQGQIDSSLSGTLQYLAPQRLSSCRKNKPLTKQVDIWSLGIILYELFTGQTPFTGNKSAQILEQIYQGCIRNKRIPFEAMSLIHDILHIQTSKRLTLQQIKQHPYLQKATKTGQQFLNYLK